MALMTWIFISRGAESRMTACSSVRLRGGSGGRLVGVADIAFSVAIASLVVRRCSGFFASNCSISTAIAPALRKGGCGSKATAAMIAVTDVQRTSLARDES